MPKSSQSKVILTSNTDITLRTRATGDQHGWKRHSQTYLALSTIHPDRVFFTAHQLRNPLRFGSHRGHKNISSSTCMEVCECPSLVRTQTSYLRAVVRTVIVCRWVAVSTATESGFCVFDIKWLLRTTVGIDVISTSRVFVSPFLFVRSTRL